MGSVIHPNGAAFCRDRAGIHINAFDFDWAVCSEKARFQRLVEKNATKVPGGSDAVATATAAAKAVLRARYLDVMR